MLFSKIDTEPSFNSSINSCDLSSAIIDSTCTQEPSYDPNLDLSIHLLSVVHLFGSSNILSVPVLSSGLTSSAHVTTIIAHCHVDNKRKDYQPFQFLFALSTRQRKRKNITASSVFSFKTFQALGGATRRIFKVISVIRSTNNNFDPNLIQVLIQVMMQTIQNSSIQVDDDFKNTPVTPAGTIDLSKGDGVDIFDVRFRTDFIHEGFSKHDTVREEDYISDPIVSIEVYTIVEFDSYEDQSSQLSIQITDPGCSPSIIADIELTILHTRPLLKDRFSITANYYHQYHHHDCLLSLQLGNIFSMTKTMNYYMHHYRRCNCVTSDSLDAREILRTSPLPTVSAFNIILDKTIDLLNINFNECSTQAPSLTSNFVVEQQPLQEPSGIPSYEPRRCPDNLPSPTIGIDSSASSSELRHHLLKLQLDNLFSMTVNYHLHHRRCRSDTSVKTNDGPFIDPSFDSSTFIIISPIDVSSFDPRHGPNNYPSSDCPSFVPSFSRGSSLHLFASNSELNLHSDDVSRVDSSTNPSIDPSSYLIMCPTDNPSRDPSFHPFDSNSESYIQPKYVSRFDSSAK